MNGLFCRLNGGKYGWFKAEQLAVGKKQKDITGTTHHS